jgi:hypothetical protein
MMGVFWIAAIPHVAFSKYVKLNKNNGMGLK